ncbi:MAG: site-2 protease family protein [Kiritimatiellia bacterium]
MAILDRGIPLGRVFGINVRLHLTFLLYALYRIQSGGNPVLALLHLSGLYGCILLHEIGHALASRWCDGEAEEILLWPLGGLAYTRPAFHPTAHLISTVAGPTVTLALWLGFSFGSLVLAQVLGILRLASLGWLLWFFSDMARLNLWLLLFNLIPAFPMDGGRILRDLLWFPLGVERATRVAVAVSRLIAIVAGVWAIVRGEYWIVMLAVFIFLQSGIEYRLLAWQGGVLEPFSVRERIRRNRRKAAFTAALRTESHDSAVEAFHRCAVCGRTEHDDPNLEFRVCPDCSGGREYCLDHLDRHQHR